MLRRNLWHVFGIAIPVFALVVTGVAQVGVAQDHKDKPKAGAKDDKHDDKGDKKHDDKKEKDILETAAGAGHFKTFGELVKAADLESTLKGAGPYTVFAPTDEAFAKLPKGTLDDWKKPENKAKLKTVLLGHVVKGKMMAAEVQKAKTIKTEAGTELKVSEKDKKWMVDNATITKTDTAASNGVIHTIDMVLMSKEKE